MTQVVAIFVDLLREAWIALTSALLIFALLAILAQVLRTSFASALGARFWIWEAISSGVALAALALFAFLGVPAILTAAQSVVPTGGGCGPIIDLGTLTAGMMAALAALRIIVALISSIAAAAVGGSSSLAGALLETGEAVFGMVLAAAATPIAVQFLGVC